VVAVAAWLIRKGRSVEEGRVMLSMTLWLLTFLVPLQIFLGDQHGLNTAAHQPAKVAAIEARWDTQPSFPLTLFAIPDPANETNRYAIEVPYLGSLILTHSLDGAIKGPKEFNPEDRPPVAIPFFAFRIMVGIGLLMLAVVAVSWWLRYRGRLFDSPWFLWLCIAMGPLGFIAVLAGWTTTELGRQPWTVYGLLRTADSTSPSLVGRAPLLAGLHGGLSDHLPVRGPHRAATGAQGPGGCARDRRADRERAAECADQHRARAGRQDAMNALNFVPVWTLILGAGIFFYVLLDGFDLGVGMLYNFMPDTRSRNLVMNAIAPVWDGNETWLVMGGVALLAAFPLAFAILIPALYFPILVMLLALVFRGVAFEFRFRDAEHKTFWDHGFFYGSLIATLAQGMMLGAFIQGFKVEGRAFAGGPLDFLTPFSFLTGIALVFGYGLLGAGWLVLKTEDEIQ